MNGCLHCGEPLELASTGRPRRYCGARCRVAAHRARRAALRNDADVTEAGGPSASPPPLAVHRAIATRATPRAAGMGAHPHYRGPQLRGSKNQKGFPNQTTARVVVEEPVVLLSPLQVAEVALVRRREVAERVRRALDRGPGFWDPDA